MKTLHAALAATALSLPALAGGPTTEQCHTRSIPLTTTAWVDTITVPRFDPNDGILQGIRYQLSGRIVGSAGVESQDAAPTTVTVDFEGQIVLTRPDLTELAVVQPLTQLSTDLSADDGNLDFGGTSGFVFDPVEAMDTIDAVSPPPASDLVLFTGPAGNPGTIDLPISAMGLSTCSGAGNLFCQFMQQAEATVTICYDFFLDCDGNGTPDNEQPDCDGNGIPDVCDDPCVQEDVPCTEFDLNIDLTPLDTFTRSTSAVNPEHEQGYFYAYAQSLGGDPIKRDVLIGNLIVVDGMGGLQYGVNPVDYRAGSTLINGANTDMDGDGIRDLNGTEYEKTAGELLFPRFLGQGGRVDGELIMINMSGGSQFTTTLQFAVYNDDEDQFSAQHQFYCWDKVPLTDVSGVFRNQYLTWNSAQNESIGSVEYGWFRMWGSNAQSQVFDIPDPAVYGVYVERISGSAAADLPFENCTQSGHLLPLSVTGDNDEMNGAPSDQDCTANIERRHPASLLLYPEFDNRNGMATVFTVTNTSATQDVRAHLVFRGRYK